jgi:general secretion pathway protein L
MLGARLAVATRDVLGDEITEPDKAKELLESNPGKADEDPLPRIDGFDVMVQLSKAVPKDVVHDVIELDVQRGKVVIQGIVPAVADSDTIAKNMRENRCFKDVKVQRTTQYTEGRYKYQLEFELKCEEKKKPKGSAEPDASASPTSSAKPDKTESGK